MRSIFGLMLTAGQLVIGMHFLAKIIDSDRLAGWFASGSKVGYGYSSGSAWPVPSLPVGPAKALLIILAFMIFSYIMMTIVPAAVEKKERRIGMDFDV